ncbi:hypothetical protein Taro_040659 [Colocasia esculenta]|uniref:E3 ubiquitin-protein ligase LIN n=1 Tax=Colocasia esculenta TaxID=4460 RepID=A0A843WCE8_COLES|nr:hypothetical protein [Colocasia esculenta]
MSSLQDLLSQEGFLRRKPTKPRETRRRSSAGTSPASAAAAPAPTSSFLCHDRRSVDLSSFSSHRTSSRSTSAAGSTHHRSRVSAAAPPDGSPGSAVADAAASRAAVSILSGYVGRYPKDAAFRRRVRERCAASLAAARRKDAAHAMLVNLEMGMEAIERLADKDPGDPGNIKARSLKDPSDARDQKIRSLRNSIRLLSIVASLSSPKSRDGFTCGVPNSHLSACAQLYLAIVYKMQKEDRVAARHLLQVFCDAPYLARRTLLPDLWEHFFLPHLLHLDIWFNKEEEAASAMNTDQDRRRMKWLSRVYNDQMDKGTAQFALYYKEWLKVGAAAAPAVPSVSLPPAASYSAGSGKRSVSVSPCSVNRNLYQAVFGPSSEREGSEDGVLAGVGSAEVERDGGMEEGSCKHGKYAHSDMGVQQRLARHSKETSISGSTSAPRKSYSFRLFSCRSDPNKGTVCRSHIPRKETVENLEISKASNLNLHLLDLGQAITLISASDNLHECEYAIRTITKAWLDAHGDPIVETALSTTSVIEGLLEVSFTSKDEEIVELTISLLAELVARSDVNRQVVLNADPQLEIFLKLLRVHSLFLKGAVLLYLLKPKAKQMLSLDWIPIVLNILEHGDQRQTLFSVHCRPKSAAFYFLDQLLKGFDVDRNVENAKQVVALGGLRLLIRKLERGDSRERKNAASLLVICIRADGSCREYLATNVQKTSIIELLIGNQTKSNGYALSLLVELIRLHRRTQAKLFLSNLKNEGCLNAMHILLVCLQQAPAEQRPLIAAILLQLDLLGDPLRYSVYREEGIDALVVSMDSNSSKKVQESCSRALSILGGRFSSTGEDLMVAWLLQRAGFDDGATYSFSSKEIIGDEVERLDEDEVAMEDWQRRLANILLNKGNKRFFTSLSNCIAAGVPALARSCLVTAAWLSFSLSLLPGTYKLWSLAWSILTPRLLDSLNYDRPIEERVIASFSLCNLTRNSECLSKLPPLDKQSVALLRDLAQVTWTAREILSVATADAASCIKL